VGRTVRATRKVHDRFGASTPEVGEWQERPLRGRNPPVASRSTSGRYRRIFTVPAGSGKGLLTEPTAATQAQPPERVLMPLSGHSLVADRLSQKGGKPSCEARGEAPPHSMTPSARASSD
jgi:hypothetical protein